MLFVKMGGYLLHDGSLGHVSISFVLVPWWLHSGWFI